MPRTLYEIVKSNSGIALWNTQLNNLGSLGIAEKLGYQKYSISIKIAK
jgi:hypothetical protein